LLINYFISFEQESFDLEEVAMRHFKSAISSVKPSDVEFYQKLAKDFRRYVDGGAPPRKQYSRRWLGLKRGHRNFVVTCILKAIPFLFSATSPLFFEM